MRGVCTIATIVPWATKRKRDWYRRDTRTSRSTSFTTTPSVSIVVIGFNEEAHIAECLESIFAQRASDSMEVVVVDDGSTDRMATIVESMEKSHPQLRLIRHRENRGRGAARRTGQDACRADMIGLIDSDILLPTDWLARTTAALESADAVSVAVPDGDCAVIWRIFGPKPKGFAGYWSLTGNNVLFRRSALTRVGWPEQSRLTEDNRMAVAMADAGLTVTTLRDLKVEHHEAKSYRKAIAFSFETGFNANEILRDLRLYRFPDLVWTGWVVCLLAGVTLVASQVVTWWLALAGILTVTIAIDIAAMEQRFYFRATPLRWVAATIGNLPLITTYLGARTICAPRLLLARRAVTH